MFLLQPKLMSHIHKNWGFAICKPIFDWSLARGAICLKVSIHITHNPRVVIIVITYCKVCTVGMFFHWTLKTRKK